jgi:hypothetical protein
MISMNGFLHREQLTSLISRWFIHRQEPGDVQALKRIVNFNAYVGCLSLDTLARAIFTALHGDSIGSIAATNKGQLKDFMTRDRVYVTPRIEELIARYQRYPEDFYRETPLNGRVYHGRDSGRYFGSMRLKRFRRIAEKSSRYLVDFLFQQVKLRADELAGARAASLGIPKTQLTTSIEEQVAEFTRAERRVLNAIRAGDMVAAVPTMHLNDILGIKVVADEPETSRLMEYLNQGQTRIVDREVHRGTYNATNVIVRYRWPREMALARPPFGRPEAILRSRGCSCDIGAAYRDFVATAEDDVLVEVIVSSYEDMLESEIGRSMHEERILAQRQSRPYHGFLARNVEYLLEYMFRLCLSPVVDAGEIPIQLWTRYMPDYVDQVYQQLFGLSVESDFTQACLCGGAAPGTEEIEAIHGKTL